MVCPLECFIAIDAQALKADTDFIHFVREGETWVPEAAWYKDASDGDIRTAPHGIDNADWLPADELFKHFKNGTIGTQIKLYEDDEAAKMGLLRSFTRTNTMEQQPDPIHVVDEIDDIASNFGAMFRLKC